MSVQAAADKQRMGGIACGICVALLFSGFIIVSRLGFVSQMKLIDIAALRFFIAGTLMWPVLLHYGFSGVHLRDAAALAFFGGLGFALLAFTGFFMAPASHGGVLLHGTLPLFSSLFARWMTKRQLGARRVCGLLVILAGIVAMVCDSLGSSTPRQLLGDGSLLAASICWSIYGLLAQRLDLKPVRSAAIVAVLSMCCYIPVYIFLPGKALFAASWQDLAVQGLIQGVLVGGLGVFIYSKAVAALGAVDTALFAAAVPGLTTVTGIFLLGEIPGLFVVAGVALVTAGMALALKS